MQGPHQLVTTPDGARIAMRITGEGDGLPILLIPGLGAAASVFDPIVPALERRHPLIRYDPRGVGDSEPGTAALTMQVMVGDAVAVLDAAGSAQANILGGSMGGAVAQHLAVTNPHRVAMLLLAATALGGRKAIPPDTRATDALLGKGARTPADAYRIACTVLYSPHFQRTHPEFIEAQVRQRAAHPVRPRVFSEQLVALASAPDITDALTHISAPTLVTHGTADAVTPVENARLLAGTIPNARSRWFQECGHLFFHERPEESARVFHEFVRDASPGG